jgi:hypothetical protein
VITAEAATNSSKVISTHNVATSLQSWTFTKV